MKKVDIGVVGAGIYGNYHTRTYSCDPYVETVVFCDLNKERRAATQNRYQIRGYVDVKKMIMTEKLDAISIATPDPYHYEPTRAAMEAGIKYLMIEKLPATSVEEYEELIAMVGKYDVQIATDFHKRWDPACNNMRDEILMNKENIIRGYMPLDDVIDVSMNWLTWIDQSSPSWFLGVHYYDLIRYVSGSEVESVYAVGSKQVLKKQGYQTYDSIQAIPTMQDGSSWMVKNSWIPPNTYPKSNDGQLVVVTEHKYLKNESYRGVKTYTDKKVSLPNYIFMKPDEHHTSGFGLEPMQDFVSDIVNQRSSRTNAYDGLQATRTAAVVHASAENGNVIHLQKNRAERSDSLQVQYTTNLSSRPAFLRIQERKAAITKHVAQAAPESNSFRLS